MIIKNKNEHTLISNINMNGQIMRKTLYDIYFPNLCTAGAGVYY